jgi:hypothetical protein
MRRANKGVAIRRRSKPVKKIQKKSGEYVAGWASRGADMALDNSAPGPSMCAFAVRLRAIRGFGAATCVFDLSLNHFSFPSPNV